MVTIVLILVIRDESVIFVPARSACILRIQMYIYIYMYRDIQSKQYNSVITSICL